MKIQGRRPDEAQELNLSVQRAQKATGTEGKDKVTSTERQRQADRIDISQKGKEVASIIASLNSLPDVREEKVQSIKEAINSGTYKVDAIKVAEKMLSEI